MNLFFIPFQRFYNFSPMLIGQFSSFVNIRMAFGNMFAMAGKKLQVFYAVVVFQVVNMVDNFFSCQVSAKMFFHYQTMLKYSSTSIPIWVVPANNFNVSSIKQIFTTLAHRFFCTADFIYNPFRHFSAHMGFGNFSVSFIRVFIAFQFFAYLISNILRQMLASPSITLWHILSPLFNNPNTKGAI